MSLSVAPGQVLGIIGPNGSGKSTLLHCLLGLLLPEAGTVWVFGLDPVRDRPRLIRRLGAVLDGSRWLFPPLTVEQALSYLGLLRDVPWRRLRLRIREAAERLKIEDLLGRRLYTLSLGQRQRVLLAAATLTDPDLLVLDEPTTGLDDASVQHMARAIREEARRGRAVVVASHQLEWLESVADSFALLARGRLLWSGRPEEPLLSAAPPPFRWVVRGELPASARAGLEALGAEVHPAGAQEHEVTLDGADGRFMEVFRVLAGSGCCTILRFSGEGWSLRELYRRVMADAADRPPGKGSGHGGGRA